MNRASQLTLLEIHSGLVIGEDRAAPSLDSSSTDAAEALMRATTAALHRPPCVVSFSGGYDSSIVLGAATAAARRGGLADPIPITWRFANAPRTRESDWQEQVVGELGLSDWLRLDAEPGYLDLVGPVAMAVGRRHGLLYPSNVHLHAPLLDRAAGGALLTGAGGDEIGNWRWRRLADARARRRKPELRDGLRWALARAPLRLRAMRERLGLDLELGWMQPDAAGAVTAAVARDQATEPARWSERVTWQARRRYLALSLDSLDLLAQDAGAAIDHPLLDRRFLAALAVAGGRDGLGNRGATYRGLLGQLLPDAVATRRDKAVFDEIFWTETARQFAADWDGRHVDTQLVNARALQNEWASDEPDARTALLLQHVALAGENLAGNQV